MSRTDLYNSIDIKRSSYTGITENYWFTVGGGTTQMGVKTPYSIQRYPVISELTMTSRRGATTVGFNAPAPLRPNPLPENSYVWEQAIYGPVFTSTVSFLKRLPGDFGSKETVVGPTGYHTGGGPGEVRASELNSLKKSLSQALLGRVKNQKVNLAQAFAERKQTADLIVGSLAALGKAYSRARRGDIVGAAKALGVSPPKGATIKEAFNRSNRKQSVQRHISSRWLELQYGWKPLLSDIFGAAEAYHAARNRKPERERVKSKGAVSSDSYSLSKSGDWQIFSSSTVTTEVTMVAYFSIDNTASKTMSELGMTNPLTIAWELTPWSFVVDWFLPIGNYISSLDATLGCTFAGGYVGTWTKGRRTITKTQGSSPDYVVRYGYETSSMEMKSYTRSAMAAFPKPQIPDFKDPFSKTHFANAVALFTTNMRR